MGSLNPDNDPKQNLDDSGYVQDDTVSKEAPPSEVQCKAGIELLDLSDDVLLYILQYLSPWDLKALGFTCSRLGALVLDRTLWLYVDARSMPSGIQRVRWLLAHALSQHTTALRLTGYAREATGCMGYMHTSRPQRVHVEEPVIVEPCAGSLLPEEDPPEVEDNPVVRGCCLNALAARYSPRHPFWPSEASARESPELVAQRCPGPRITVSPFALTRITQLCTGLTELALDYCVIDCCATKISMFPKTIKKLSLRGTKCFNIEKSFLYKIQDQLLLLEELDVSECEWIEPACMLPLSKMPALTRLLMAHCHRLTEFVAYASLATRYGFKTLKVLDLRGCPVGDSEVSALGWVCALQELYLSPAPRSPRVAPHAHSTADPHPAYVELDPWEQQEPEYYSSKYAAEQWIAEENKDSRHGYISVHDSLRTPGNLLEQLIAQPSPPSPTGPVSREDLELYVNSRVIEPELGSGNSNAPTRDPNAPQANANAPQVNGNEAQGDPDATEEINPPQRVVNAPQRDENAPEGNVDPQQAAQNALMSAEEDHLRVRMLTEALERRLNGYGRMVEGVFAHSQKARAFSTAFTNHLQRTIQNRSANNNGAARNENNEVRNGREDDNNNNGDAGKHKHDLKDEAGPSKRQRDEPSTSRDFLNVPGTSNQSMSSSNEPDIEDYEVVTSYNAAGISSNQSGFSPVPGTSSSVVENNRPGTSNRPPPSVSKHEYCPTKAERKYYDDQNGHMIKDFMNGYRQLSKDSSSSIFKPNNVVNEYSDSEDESDNDDKPQPKRARLAISEEALANALKLAKDAIHNQPSTSNNSVAPSTSSQDPSNSSIESSRVSINPTPRSSNDNESKGSLKLEEANKFNNTKDDAAKKPKTFSPINYLLSNQPSTSSTQRNTLSNQSSSTSTLPCSTSTEPNTSKQPSPSSTQTNTPSESSSMTLNTLSHLNWESADENSQSSSQSREPMPQGEASRSQGESSRSQGESSRSQGEASRPWSEEARPPGVASRPWSEDTRPPSEIPRPWSEARPQPRRQRFIRFRHNEPPIIVEGVPSYNLDINYGNNNNNAQQPDCNVRFRSGPVAAIIPGPIPEQAPDLRDYLRNQYTRPYVPNAPDLDADPEVERPNNEAQRHRILYINVGRRRHAIHHVDRQEPVDGAQNPANLRYYVEANNVPPLNYDSLVTDAAIRRFGRADGENVNYIQLGPVGPFEDPHARPNRSNLRVLSVTGYRNITDYSLMHLATAAPHLQVLDVTGTRVTESGVLHFRNLRPDCKVKHGPTSVKDIGRPHPR